MSCDTRRLLREAISDLEAMKQPDADRIAFKLVAVLEACSRSEKAEQQVIANYERLELERTVKEAA